MSEGDIQAIGVTIRREEVIRFLGYPEGRFPAPRVEAVLDPTIDQARRLANARGTWTRLPVVRAGELGLASADAKALAIGLVTAGPEIEACAAEVLAHGDSVRALVLDAAGSAAAEEAADRLAGYIVGAGAEDEPRAVPCRFSPGYGAWELAAQSRLFALLPHRALGVTLLPSMMMIPRKSISFAVWLGGGETAAVGLAGCTACALRDCQHRRATRREART